MDSESRNQTLLISLFGAVFLVRHTAGYGIYMLAGSVFAEVPGNYAVPFVKSRQYLYAIGAFDSGANLAFFDVILRIN
jgi:hypothetical protein